MTCARGLDVAFCIMCGELMRSARAAVGPTDAAQLLATSESEAHGALMGWPQRISAKATCARRTWGLCAPCAWVIGLGLPLDLLRRKSGQDTTAVAHSHSDLPATGGIENP